MKKELNIKKLFFSQYIYPVIILFNVLVLFTLFLETNYDYMQSIVLVTLPFILDSAILIIFFSEVLVTYNQLLFSLEISNQEQELSARKPSNDG